MTHRSFALKIGLLRLAMEVYSVLLQTTFFLLIVTVRGYNVDTDFPITYSSEDVLKGGNPFSSDSFFGYSVHLYAAPSKSSSCLIIGAPKGNYSSSSRKGPVNPVEPGVVYRCAMNKTCQEITPIKVEDEEYVVTKLPFKLRTEKQHGWFGSAMSVDNINGILTVCAPRTIVRIFNPFGTFDVDTMQGGCYSDNVLSNGLQLEIDDLQLYDYLTTYWYNPMHGFSVHHAAIKGNSTRGRGKIIGRPKHETYGTVLIKHSNRRFNIELPASDDVFQLGYSVESGYFFKKDQLLYVGGAPSWKYVGQVAIINPTEKPPVIAKVHGTELGEYFGASLAVGDVNNDGLDDLVIGAPHWGQDNGRVYLYLGSSKGQFYSAAILEGAIENGQFGYAVACGDLDADGFDDIIVGAPWEGNGVIYVYNGGADLMDNNLKSSERIEAPKQPKIKTFGFSISKPVDIDDNGYADIAVGAYKSGHAVLFRSKPVIEMQLAIRTVPDTLERTEKQFAIIVCPLLYKQNSRIVSEFKVILDIDQQYQRAEQTFVELKLFNSDSYACLTTRVNISENVLDFIEPISIMARHELVYGNTSEFCKWCPVERRDNTLNTVTVSLPFNINCGEDKICNSNISASSAFHGTRDSNKWVVGSGDISLEVDLENHEEPAYLTTVKFLLPESVVLRSILPSCQEITTKEKLAIICDAGNPIWKGEKKSIKLDLDMKHLNYSALYQNMSFVMIIDTASKDHGTKIIHKHLFLVNEVSLSLNGKAIDESYYLSSENGDAANISFQHTYQVYKLGATPVKDAQLIIKVPTTIKGSKPLINVYKPQLYVSGEIYECFSDNVFLDNQSTEVIETSTLDEFNMLLPNEMEYDENHLINKRNANESVELYGVENISLSEALYENLTTDFIYVNCSNLNVTCIRIVCNLNALKTLQDIGKVIIKFVLNTAQLEDTFTEGRAILKFATQADVEIMKPATRISINNTRTTMELATVFYNRPKVEKLQLWIVVLSVSIGLLLLVIIVVILSKFGFFRRKAREDVAPINNEME